VGAWRLPSSRLGPYQGGYNSTTTGAYSITSSEMGHLFYTELRNSGELDTSAVETTVLFDDSNLAKTIHDSGTFVNLKYGNLWWGRLCFSSTAHATEAGPQQCG